MSSATRQEVEGIALRGWRVEVGGNKSEGRGQRAAGRKGPARSRLLSLLLGGPQDGSGDGAKERDSDTDGERRLAPYGLRLAPRNLRRFVTCP